MFLLGISSAACRLRLPRQTLNQAMPFRQAQGPEWDEGERIPRPRDRSSCSR